MSIDYVIVNYNDSDKLTIHEFEKMSEGERNSYQGILSCPKCLGKAGFRRSSVDGKSPCFFAKHIGKCSWATSNDSDKNENEDNVETNIIEVDTSSIGIRWNYKQEKGDSIGSDGSNEDFNIETSGKKHTLNPPKKIQAKLTLRQILTYAEIDKLQEIDIEVNLNGNKYELFQVVNHVSNIKSSFIGKSYFFWGEMKYFKDNFINLRGSNTSIIIDENIIDVFKSRYNEKFYKVIKSNSFILFGKLIKKNSSYYVILDDPNKIYFKGKEIFV